MPIPEVDWFKEILNQAVDYTMEHEMVTAAASVIQGAVETEVYAKYSPKRYVRQRDLGGLLDPHEIDHHYDKQTKTLELKDVRDDAETKEWRWKQTGDPDYTVADVVENGGPYMYRVRIGPRPFHSVAEKRLIDMGVADKVLEDGLSVLNGWSQ